jgi:hypothetical protein
MLKPAILLLLTAIIAGVTSCCRYRPYPSYWDHGEAVVKVELEKKDLKRPRR